MPNHSYNIDPPGYEEVPQRRRHDSIMANVGHAPGKLRAAPVYSSYF
jgi:hypothetical protein